MSEKYAVAQALRERAQKEDWRKRNFDDRLDEAHVKGGWTRRSESLPLWS